MKSAGMQQLVTARMAEHIAVTRTLLDDRALVASMGKISRVIVSSLKSGKKVFFFGNGGSAADAQHLAAELSGRYLKDRRPLSSWALTTNTSALTAIANDYAFDMVFARQLEGLAERGDVAIAISTSGNSSNILQAVALARRKKVVTIAMTGSRGGKLASLADYCLRVPSDVTPRVQECHILLGHILCEIIERELFA